jgi:hypothetical protein
MLGTYIFAIGNRSAIVRTAQRGSIDYRYRSREGATVAMTQRTIGLRDRTAGRSSLCHQGLLALNKPAANTQRLGTWGEI